MSRTKMKAILEFHECPQCGAIDVCRTKMLHRCKRCGNVWGQDSGKEHIGPRELPYPFYHGERVENRTGDYKS